MGQWASFVSQRNESLVGERDCPEMLNHTTLRWRSHPPDERQKQGFPPEGDTERHLRMAAFEICNVTSSEQRWGIGIPIGPYRGLEPMRQLAKQLFVISHSEMIAPCSCSDRPFINWQSSIFALPQNFHALMKVAKERLHLHYREDFYASTLDTVQRNAAMEDTVILSSVEPLN